jgi:hypothetical protein
MSNEVRTVLGLTADLWVLVALVLAALVAAGWEIVDLLDSRSAVRMALRRDRPSSLPEVRR